MVRRPLAECVLVGLAGSLVLALAVMPTTPWLTPECRPLALGLSTAWLLWRLWALDRALAHRRAWSRNSVWTLTPEALAPQAGDEGVFLGKAFAWDATHTQGLETALALDGALPIATDARGGHPVLHAVGQKQEQPLVLPASELVGHVLITGTTRSGKTRMLEVLAAETIRSPGAVVVVDPKGDRELLARCAAEAQRNHKLFALITPAFPQESDTINVLDTATTPAEVSARIRALMPSGQRSDPFFEEYSLALIERLATVQEALGIPWTLEGLYAVSTLRLHMERLLEAYLVHRGYHATGKLSDIISEYRKRGPVDLVADALIDDLEKPRDHFTKVTANLIPTFRGVIGAPLGQLFSTIPADVTWTRIIEEELVVYIGLASLLLGDIANRIGRVILQDLMGYLGRRYAFEDMANTTPITIFIDELRNVVYPLFVDAVSKGGGAQARFCLAQQSLADTEAALGSPALARVLYDNCNTRIWTRLADDRTAKEATEGLGLCTVWVPKTSVGLGFGGVGGLSGSSHLQLEPREVPLIRPTWLTALPRGESFVRMKGEVWKLRTPLLTPVSQETLDGLGLTALWQSMAPAALTP